MQVASYNRKELWHCASYTPSCSVVQIAFNKTITATTATMLRRLGVVTFVHAALTLSQWSCKMMMILAAEQHIYSFHLITISCEVQFHYFYYIYAVEYNILLLCMYIIALLLMCLTAKGNGLNFWEPFYMSYLCILIVCLSVCLPVCLSTCLCICLSVSVSICLFIRPAIVRLCLSVCQSLSLSNWSFCPSLSLFVSIPLSVWDLQIIWLAYKTSERKESFQILCYKVVYMYYVNSLNFTGYKWWVASWGHHF